MEKNDPEKTLNLFQILFDIETFPAFLGLSLRHYFSTHRKIYPIYIFLFLGSIEVIIINSLPTAPEYEFYIMHGPDIVYWSFGPARRLGTPIQFVYLGSGLIFLWHHYSDSYEWVPKAQYEMQHFKMVRKSIKITKYIRNARILYHFAPYFMLMSFSMVYVLSFVVWFERNLKYPFGFLSWIYFIVLHFYLTAIMASFLVRYYLLCRIATDCYRQLNQHTMTQIRQKRDKFAVFFDYYEEYSRICSMFQHFRENLLATFVSYSLLFLPLSAFLLYSAVHAKHVNMITRLLCAFVMPAFTGMAILLAFIIGEVPQTASKLEVFWFGKLVCRHGAPGKAPECYKKIFAYFNQIYKPELGIIFLGSQINSKSLFTLISIFGLMIVLWSGNIHHTYAPMDHPKTSTPAQIS